MTQVTAMIGFVGTMVGAATAVAVVYVQHHIQSRKQEKIDSARRAMLWCY